MQTGDINVSTESLNQGATDIKTCLAALNEAISNTKAAGEAAISAVGGTSTKIGGAINGKLVAVDEEQFKKACASLEELANSLAHTSNEYDEEENALLQAIESHVPTTIQD